MSERPNDVPEESNDDPAVMNAEDTASASAVPEESAASSEADAEARGDEPEDDGAAEDETEPDDADGDLTEDLLENEGLEPVAAGAPTQSRSMRPAERRAARSGLSHGQLPIDPALRIKDRTSAVLVLVIVGVFAIILLNALVLGHGGLLTPLPTATPIPSIPTP